MNVRAAIVAASVSLSSVVTAQTAAGQTPMPITVEEAVRAYTLGSSFAEFQEGSKGTLTPGKLADIVMLSQDVFTIEPRDIEKVKVVLTIMDGRIVYSSR